MIQDFDKIHKYHMKQTENIMEDFIVEETVGMQNKRAAVMVGRLNPPTAGHYKVLDAMKAFIKNRPNLKLDAPILVIVDGEQTSKDKHKNPLSAEDRVKFIEASGRANGVIVLVAASGFAAFEAVRRAGFEPIAVAAGSDRADKYIGMLDKYFTTKNGNKIKHVKIDDLARKGQDEKNELDATAMDKALKDLKSGSELDLAEVSGSMARRAVELGYEEEFAQIVGLAKNPALAKLLFKKIKASMGELNGPV